MLNGDVLIYGLRLIPLIFFLRSRALLTLGAPAKAENDKPCHR